LYRVRASSQSGRTMCNLYSMTKSQAAIRDLVRAMRDTTGNLPPLPGIFPDMLAPVVRTTSDRARELMMMRWGFPPLPDLGTRPVTNIRNTRSSYWRAWLAPAFRCLVPVTSFCEYTDTSPKVAHWFARDETRPLFFLAGIWRPWTGRRGTKANPVEGEHLLFSVLTCEPNDVVRPIHAKAMPVVLATEAERETWLEAPVEEALALQKPSPAKPCASSRAARKRTRLRPEQAQRDAWLSRTCGHSEPNPAARC
jgi:putative SOS response-associated peptidase YedK